MAVLTTAAQLSLFPAPSCGELGWDQPPAPPVEDDALAYDMAEGAPLLLDEVGAHDDRQAHRDYVALANEYADIRDLQAAA